jgi:hypothetical protein
MDCTYAFHPATATHYYRTAAGTKLHLCADCASSFGYPEYLVPVQPAPWRKEYGYLVNAHIGDGSDDLVADLWPFEGDDAERWLRALGNQDKYLLADAAWEPYRAHQSEAQGLTIECTRVTCLPLVQV